MRRKRKTRRTRLRARPILWLLLTANIGIGMAYSPLTSLRQVRVEGAESFDQDRLTTILGAAQDVPFALANPGLIESSILDLPEVKAAELKRNLFGNGLLVVEYRRPVARFFNKGPLALSNDGVIYLTHASTDELPAIQLAPGRPPATVTIVGSWLGQAMAELAKRTQKFGQGRDIRIQVDSQGILCLNIGTGRVILGSSYDLDKKLSVLSDRLRRNPKELSQVESLNLTSPEAPSVVPKSVELTH